MEQCQKCGEFGEDRRSLLMSCLYEMSELNVPYERIEINGRKFYMLRVCKDCRGDWLIAIEAWFNDNHTSVGYLNNATIKVEAQDGLDGKQAKAGLSGLAKTIDFGKE